MVAPTSINGRNLLMRLLLLLACSALAYRTFHSRFVDRRHGSYTFSVVLLFISTHLVRPTSRYGRLVSGSLAGPGDRNASSLRERINPSLLPDLGHNLFKRYKLVQVVCKGVLTIWDSWGSCIYVSLGFVMWQLLCELNITMLSLLPISASAPTLLPAIIH